MASFTDQIPQFNPYISQLPIDAMVQVGMEKQRRYDEGITKIQTAIDNIAGLDLIKDPHKAYLQTKLNELGGNLKGFAAADFSNYQLVNSVTGMTNQLIKDPIIQNAVASTQFIRKQQEFIESQKKEGKTSSQNIDWFNKGLSEWLGDGDVSTRFSEEYVPYTDLDKKWREIQKDLGATETTTQLPFLMNEAGQFVDENNNVLGPDEKPHLNMVMVEKTFKGKTPQAIKNAIMASMSEDDIRQLKIDGWHHYKDYSVGQLKTIADNGEKEYINTLNNQMKVYNAMKSLNPNNKKYQDEVDAMIDNLKKDYENSMNEYGATVNLITNNPDEFRYQVYAKRAINEFATANSNYSESVKYLDSPYQAYIDKERNYKLAVDRFFEEQRHNKASESIDWAKYSLDLQKYQDDKEEKRKKAGGPGGGLLDKGALATTLLEGKSDPQAFLDKLNDDKETIRVSKENFRKEYFPDMSEEDFEKQYAFYLKHANDGTDMTPQWSSFIENISPLEASYNNNAAIVRNVQNEMDGMNEKDWFKSRVDAGLISTNPADYGKTGRTTPMTSDELYRIWSSGSDKVDIPEAKGLFPTQEQWESHTAGKKLVLTEKGKKHNGIGSFATYEESSEYQNELLKKLAPRLNDYQPWQYSFNASTPERRNFVSNKFTIAVQRIGLDKEKQTRDNPYISDFDYEKASALAVNPNTNFSVIRRGNNEIYLSMSGEVDGKGVKPQVMRITPKDYFDLFGEPITSPDQEASDFIFQNGNTNPQSGKRNGAILNDPTAHETAYFKKIRGNSSLDAFPRIQSNNIKADIIQLPGADGKATGKYQSIFYIQQYSPSTQQMEWKTYGGAVSYDLESIINGFKFLDDKMLKKSLPH